MTLYEVLHGNVQIFLKSCRMLATACLAQLQLGHVLTAMHMLWLTGYIAQQRITSLSNYTVSGKKRVWRISGITSSNAGRFSKFFHSHNLLKICNKAITKYPHLRRVATLPCEKQMSENQLISEIRHIILLHKIEIQA